MASYLDFKDKLPFQFYKVTSKGVIVIAPSLNTSQFLETLEVVGTKFWDDYAWDYALQQCDEGVARTVLPVIANKVMENTVELLQEIKAPVVSLPDRLVHPNRMMNIRASQYREVMKAIIRDAMASPYWRSLQEFITHSYARVGVCVLCDGVAGLNVTPAMARVGRVMHMWFSTHLPEVHLRALDLANNYGFDGASAEILGICQRCTHKCRVCAKVVDHTVILDEIEGMRMEGLCVQCRGGSLLNVLAPKLNTPELRAFARKMRAKKGGMVV